MYVLTGIGGAVVLIAVIVVVVQLCLGRAAQRRREQLEAKHRAETAQTENEEEQP